MAKLAGSKTACFLRQAGEVELETMFDFTDRRRKVQEMSGVVCQPQRLKEDFGAKRLG